MVKSKTMTTESTITTTEQITYDSDMMSAELDKIQLNKSQTIKGILRLVICSAIGIAAFFVSVPHNGTEMYLVKMKMTSKTPNTGRS